MGLLVGIMHEHGPSNKMCYAGISDTFFQASPISWIQYIGSGRVVGSGSGWGVEGRFFNTFEQKTSHCVFFEVHKQP